MKIFYITLCALFVSTLSFGQTCFPLKMGQEINVSVHTWPNPPAYDVKFIKMNASKQEEKINEYNAQIESGALAPTAQTFIYKVTQVDDENAPHRVQVSTVIAGTTYSSLEACQNDTMYYTRNVGPVWLANKGDTLGVGFQGVEKIPMNLKIGDMLPAFEDFGATFPTTISSTEKASLFKGVKTSVSYKTDFGYDAASGKFGLMDWKVTSSQNIYEQIDVKVRQTTSLSSQVINYAVAVVTKQEEVTVNGKKYNAFVIESQSWAKATYDVTYNTSNAKVTALKQQQSDALQAKMEKKMMKRGFTNELGYMVTYKTEWFVPGTGIVKIMTYDSYGGISSETLINL